MAIGIENYPNTDNTDPGNYPAGALRDDDGSDNGTPVNRLTNNDIHQFFFVLLTRAGVAANGLPENVTNGYQYNDALLSYIRSLQAFETVKGVAELATQAEVTTGTDDERIVTPLKLATHLGATIGLTTAWTDLAAASTGATNFTKTDNATAGRFKKVGKTVHINYMIDFNADTVANGLTAKLTLSTSTIGTKSTSGFEGCIVSRNVTDGTYINQRVRWLAGTTDIEVDLNVPNLAAGKRYIVAINLSSEIT